MISGVFNSKRLRMSVISFLLYPLRLSVFACWLTHMQRLVLE